MADYADPREIEYIEKKYAGYPSSSEIGRFCYYLGIEIDSLRTLHKEEAWAYYHELKAKVDAKQRKTA
jgi:hypothetical protein